MSNHARRVKLSEFKERRMTEAAVIVVADDGTEFVIPPPELWPDEFGAAAASSDLPKMAEIILGADGFADFKAKGGTAKILNAIYADAQGEEPGK